jgi:tetratricopeptide (TPR) repeat protein
MADVRTKGVGKPGRVGEKMNVKPAPSPFEQHHSLAEKGKMLAQKHKHAEALELYREALAKAQFSNTEPVVLRYYIECILESLEHTGAFTEILTYCDHAREHYKMHPPKTIWQKKDLASIHERAMLMHIKLGNQDAAKEDGAKATTYAKQNGFELHLANKVMRWLLANLHISRERIEQEQKKNGYFTITTCTS